MAFFSFLDNNLDYFALDTYNLKLSGYTLDDDCCFNTLWSWPLLTVTFKFYACAHDIH